MDSIYFIIPEFSKSVKSGYVDLCHGKSTRHLLYNLCIYSLSLRSWVLRFPSYSTGILFTYRVVETRQVFPVLLLPLLHPRTLTPFHHTFRLFTGGFSTGVGLGVPVTYTVEGTGCPEAVMVI